MEKRHRGFAACALFLFALCSCEATLLPQAGQPHLQAEFKDPRQALDALLAVVSRNLDSLPAATQVLLTPIVEDAEWLRDARPGWPAADYQEFTLAIELNTLLISDFLASDRRDSEPIRIVALDLNIKRQQCRASGGPRTVAVEVRTRDSANNPVSGYEVWFVKKGFEKKPAYYRSFPTHSSPAVHQIQDAGYYVLWSARPAAAAPVTGPRRDIEIGPGQQIAIDLPIPPA